MKAFSWSSAARADLLAVAALAAGVAVGHAWFGAKLETDSDRHYHFAISRDASWSGRLDKVPQVEDLGWGTRFVDKEWLFHVATTWGYRAAGERGVVVACALLAFFTAVALYGLCRTAAGPGTSFAFTAAVALLDATFLYRLEIVRPHVLAIGLLLWVCVGLRTGRLWLAALASAGFALAYHAFYVPLLVAACQWVLTWRERGAWKVPLAALAGLALGTLLNPYFPHNLTMGVTHLKTGLAAATAAGAGVELTPLSTARMLQEFAAPLFACALAVARPWVSPFSVPQQRQAVLWALAAAAGFWALACITPRAAEYAVPLSAVVAAQALAGVGWRWQAAAAGLAALLQVPGWSTAREVTPSELYALAVPPAVARLPPEAAGHKVLNCAFDEGAVLLHLRPDVRFLDVLTPMLLEEASPRLAKLRDDFAHGNVLDPWVLTRKVFGADYVLCGYPEAEAMLDADPRFVRLNPPLGAPPPRVPTHNLYAALDAPVPAVRRFGVERESSPALAGELQLLPGEVFLDLRRARARGAGACVHLRVPSDEAARFEGAQLALLGGGPGLTLRQDGARVFDAQPSFTRARWNAVLVPLAAPVSSSTQLELDVCAQDGVAFHGIALSLWTWEQVRQRCQRAGAPLPASGGYAGVERTTCLAPLAVAPASP